MARTVRMVLTTTPDFFVRWLGDETDRADHMQFPAKIGHFRIERSLPRICPYPQGSAVVGAYRVFQNEKTGEEAGSSSIRAIVFQLRQVNGERTEIHAQCYLDEVGAYYEQLLGLIAETWPEASSAVESYLAREKLLKTDESQLLDVNPMPDDARSVIDDEAVPQSVAEAVPETGPMIDEALRSTTTEERLEHALQQMSARDRLIVEEWRAEKTSTQIAHKRSIKPLTVMKDLSRLRKIHGAEVVPKKRK